MRRELRIGLATGGILLAVLIVYVLVVPSSSEPEVELTTVSPEALLPVPLDVPATVPATQPLAMPTTMPIEPAPVADIEPTSSPDVWASALETGNLTPMMSQTPSLRTGASALLNSSATTRPAGNLRSYTVQRGDTLSAIAARVYGDAAQYPRILKANPNINPNRMRPGTVLQLPVDGEKATAPLSATTAPSLMAVEVAADMAVAGADPARTYRVQPGDSLQKIAGRLYGSRTMWQKLYELNRDAIGADPGQLRANMVLKLPESPAAREH